MFEHLVLMIIMYNTLLLGVADYNKDALVTVAGEWTRGRSGRVESGRGGFMSGRVVQGRQRMAGTADQVVAAHSVRACVAAGSAGSHSQAEPAEVCCCHGATKRRIMARTTHTALLLCPFLTPLALPRPPSPSLDMHRSSEQQARGRPRPYE